MNQWKQLLKEFCGNVVHVHDIVDYVTEESRKAGRSAALFVNEKEGVG